MKPWVPAVLAVAEGNSVPVPVPEAAKPFTSAFVRRRSPMAETLGGLLRSPQCCCGVAVLSRPHREASMTSSSVCSQGFPDLLDEIREHPVSHLLVCRIMVW